MTIEIRPARPDEIPQLGGIAAYVYAGAFGHGADNLPARATRPEWTLCAFDGSRMVATYATIPFTMRANGQALPLGGVSVVGTLPEYRRRGLLRAMTTRAFAEMRERGQPVAALWASQAAIYQRYGYSAASVLRRYRVDTVDMGLQRDPAPGYTVERVPITEAFDRIRAIYRAFVEPRTGYLHRSGAVWHNNALADADGPVHLAVCTRDDGSDTGYVAYTLRDGAVDHPARAQEIVVRDSAWLDISSYVALWRFIARHDLVGRVIWDNLPADDPAPELMIEPRLLNLQDREGAWFRVVDVPAALAARGYSCDDSVVLSIARDDLTPWNAGVYRLTASAGAGEVAVSSDRPDVTMSVKALASLFTGYRRAGDLWRWGLVEGTPTAVDRLDRLFATRHAPHWPDHF